MVYISDSQLSIILAELLTKLGESVYCYDYAFFRTLYDTGLRVSEVYNIHDAHLDPYDFVHVNLSKGNGVRVFAKSIFHPLILHSIIASEPFFRHHAIGHFHYVFNAFCQYRNIFILNKEKTTHLFRHSYMKNLFADGNTYDEIAAIMHLSSPFTVAGYVSAMPYYI